ncbi:MAG TPA: ATP-binding cassette domain-containing protein [Dermatophilaceae bacterium]|nr:ATP-binding cassette domain-containing protein [Dermatophilaceae bacterium]
MPRIELTNLTKHYGSVRAVDDLSFSLESGSITGFVGANGAGKSTTLRMLLGLTRPTTGTATIDGLPYAELPEPARVVGALSDPDVFHPGRTGRNALRVLARVSRIGDRRVDELLELVDLDGDARRRVGGYSMGLRQRLGLAAALLGDPPTLVLDEPANGLDPIGIAWLRGLLRGLADQGRTVLVSSHQLAELAQTVDDVILIDHGRLIARGSTTDLMASHQSDSLEQLFLDLVSKGPTS